MSNEKVFQLEIIVNLIKSQILIQEGLRTISLQDFDHAKNNVIDSEDTVNILEQKLAHATFFMTKNESIMRQAIDNLEYFQKVLGSIKEESSITFGD